MFQLFLLFEMISEINSLNETLHELTLRYEVLKRYKHESIILKKKYVQYNKMNEIILKRLIDEKSQYEYLKEILNKDSFNNSLNAGKRKVLLKHTINKFYKNCKTVEMQYQNLPVVSLLEEISQINEKLISELWKLHELIVHTKKDYVKTYEYLESNFIRKVLLFSDTFKKYKKCCKE